MILVLHFYRLKM